MAVFTDPPAWRPTSEDPVDDQFGHLVEGTTLDDADAYDAVLVGVPYDGAVISRQGASEGPAAIRGALASTKTHHFDAGPVDSLGDLGNVALPATESTAVVQGAVADTTRDVHDVGATPVFLGGDNSTTYANASPLLDETVGAATESLGVVSFDAHLDCRQVRGDPTSGSPYRQLHDDGLDALSVVGARHFETSTGYHDFVRDNDYELVTAEEVGDDDVDAVDRALDALGDVDQVYVSVDIDVLDAAYPGSSAPTPGGITTRELFRMVRVAASDDRIAGFEVVETAPPLDENDRTVDAAARTVAHFLAGLQARPGG
ncbi:formimidoylglutamase [Halorubellus sp. PRR65]|uniref:formimidoylglutamase n=1 Tax=Halorubellus sp. PRR65 TaxID=3098148 RepID=UPI002B25AE6B|nr:formimidoylglutamase [Halorubellus sp. PRR65]